MPQSRNRAVFIAVFALLAGFAAGGRTPHYGDGLYAEVETNKGLIVLRLEFEKTPLTVANFVGLAEGTIENAAFPPGRPYFDGTIWHRVVPGHVIQCGVPNGGAAKDPGYQFPNEIVLPDLNHGRAGMVNMANSGPHTNGSQWCITLGDRSYLDGDYTVFGRVVDGMDVVFSIVQGDAVKTVKIVRVGAKAQAFKPTTASFRDMVEAAKVRVRQADAEKKAKEEALIKAQWPAAADGENGVKFIILKAGHGQEPASGEKIKIVYSGKAPLAGTSFIGTADAGKPYWGDTPEPIGYTVGTTKINPGLDAAITGMKKGEKRLLIVPAGQGYGTSGFYAKQKPGEKRFVIPPNTMLVYEIERLDD